MNEEVKHFTATAMIRNEHGEFLLHEHQKLGFWLPPGGHIEVNEEPQHAVFREVLEETGLECQVVSCGFPFASQIHDSPHTQVLPLPIAILKEFIVDKKKGNHWHIDMIYLCELLPSSQPPFAPFEWVPFEALAKLNIPADVIELAKVVNECYRLQGK
ncbi:TPA: NUDIX domain-containing protein [Providencia rettgeri]|uniref:NUDIX hydrolase n=1 Tax=Providencia sp. PROV141 TaxID=2949851 RepID=UPI001BA0E261|nr:NUDIX domain-containing protein [Providencia sp. PROV141]HBC7429691.1 NUDIX domain-containing protein [Providencia rettgeri]